jgi:hypothetical protein
MQASIRNFSSLHCIANTLYVGDMTEFAGSYWLTELPQRETTQQIEYRTDAGNVVRRRLTSYHAPLIESVTDDPAVIHGAGNVVFYEGDLLMRVQWLTNCQPRQADRPMNAADWSDLLGVD